MFQFSKFALLAALSIAATGNVFAQELLINPHFDEVHFIVNPQKQSPNQWLAKTRFGAPGREWVIPEPTGKQIKYIKSHTIPQIKAVFSKAKLSNWLKSTEVTLDQTIEFPGAVDAEYHPPYETSRAYGKLIEQIHSRNPRPKTLPIVVVNSFMFRGREMVKGMPEPNAIDWLHINPRFIESEWISGAARKKLPTRPLIIVAHQAITSKGFYGNPVAGVSLAHALGIAMGLKQTNRKNNLMYNGFSPLQRSLSQAQIKFMRNWHKLGRL